MKCGSRFCSEEAIPGRLSCGFHKCEMKLNCYRIKLEGEVHCWKHPRCKISGCVNVSVIHRKLCEEHKCNVYDCDEQKFNGGSYCVEHSCQLCNNIRIDEAFCYFHIGRIDKIKGECPIHNYDTNFWKFCPECYQKIIEEF